jgi:O-antigen/teichoic acid export membrane protein
LILGKLKKLAGETVFYGLSTIVPRGLNFLLVAIHTRVFLPSEYGVITNLLSYVAFLNIVYMFGMETAYFRFVNQVGADSKKVFNQAQTVVVAISLTLTFLLIAFSKPLATALHINGHSEFIVWLALIMGVDAIVAIPFARLRKEGKPLRFAAAKIINVGIILLLSYVIFSLRIGYSKTIGIGYVFLINLIANSFYLFYLGNMLLAWRPAFDRAIFKKMITYSYPIMLTGLAGMTNEMFSRVTIGWWLPEGFYPGQTTAEALGVFGACYKFSVIMNLAIQAFRFAAEPFFFSHAADKNSPALFAQVNHYFTVFCCILLLAIAINMDVFKYYIPKNYWDGLPVVPILLLAYVFIGCYYNFTVWFKVTDKTYFGTLITAGGAIITIILNFLLIPLWGYWGSSLVTALVFFLMAASCYLWGQKYYPIPYKIGPELMLIATTMVLVYALSLVKIANQFLASGFHLSVIIAFTAIVYWIERKELGTIR